MIALSLAPLARLSTYAAPRTSEGDKAGPIGLAVILLLCIACYFLFKSMSKHMRFVRENFPGAASGAPSQSAPGEPLAAAAAASAPGEDAGVEQAAERPEGADSPPSASGSRSASEA